MERHRIQELFPESLLNTLNNIRLSGKYNHNNDKARDMMTALREYGFTDIGPGTNRFCVRHVDYIYKIAMDSYGVRDNWNEFNMSPELQPYVTKTYECNGLIAVAEYVTLINKKEFLDSRQILKGVLDILADDYMFCDISLLPKNFANWGYRLDGSLVITDYGLTK